MHIGVLVPDYRSLSTAGDKITKSVNGCLQNLQCLNFLESICLDSTSIEQMEVWLLCLLDKDFALGS